MHNRFLPNSVGHDLEVVESKPTWDIFLVFSVNAGRILPDLAKNNELQKNSSDSCNVNRMTDITDNSVLLQPSDFLSTLKTPKLTNFDYFY